MDKKTLLWHDLNTGAFFVSTPSVGKSFPATLPFTCNNRKGANDGDISHVPKYKQAPKLYSFYPAIGLVSSFLTNFHQRS